MSLSREREGDICVVSGLVIMMLKLLRNYMRGTMFLLIVVGFEAKYGGVVLMVACDSPKVEVRVQILAPLQNMKEYQIVDSPRTTLTCSRNLRVRVARARVRDSIRLTSSSPT